MKENLLTILLILAFVSIGIGIAAAFDARWWLMSGCWLTAMLCAVTVWGWE